MDQLTEIQVANSIRFELIYSSASLSEFGKILPIREYFSEKSTKTNLVQFHVFYAIHKISTRII